jgi:hypothetical protein
MTAWCHLPTIFKGRHVLRTAGLLMLSIAFFTTLLLNDVSHAATGVNQTLGFEGRLTNSDGSVVPDGNYNIQFKIYQDGSGTTAGDSDGGSLKWTESYINNGGTSGVEVKDGFFSVDLGSLNPFGTSVDWNQDTLWLSMNVAGSSASCTTFGSSPCSADGEMLPMKRITSTPYALNSGEVGGKTADNFVQLAQGVQTDASTNTSSIFINKTSTGNLIQLQSAATDVFTVGNAGDLTLGNNADKTISIATAVADTGGNSLSVEAGGGGSGTGSSGGDLILQGGSGGGTDGGGGNIQIDAGAKTGTGSDGSIAIGTANAGTITIGSTSAALDQTITIGDNNTSGSTSNVTIGAGASATAGTTAIQSKGDTTLTTDGTQKVRVSSTSNTLYVGNADTSGDAATANGFTIQGTSSTGSDVQGGAVTVQSGSATSGDANGGTLTLSGGAGAGTGAAGLVVISTPTFQTASQQDCSSDCTVTQSSVDGNGVIALNATATSLTATMGNPTITTAGRILYVTAASGSDTFTLSINGGGTGNLITMRQNTTSTLLWNGSEWTVAGASNSTTLQDVYNNTLQSTGSAGVVLGDGTSSSTFVFKDSSAHPVNGALLQVQDTSANSLLSVNSLSDGSSNVQIGTGLGIGTPTLLTLDKDSSAPTITDDTAMLGSMYYDTTLGEVQCYEASGWGNCTASPDDFVTISPEYSNAVTHGSGTGTMTSDFCSDALNINNGTSSQPTVCGTNETYNYYNWTSSDITTGQTKSIYVTYQLPSSFKGFTAGSTSLMGRTDSSDSSVSYQVYKNDSTTGLTACGSSVAVSTGSQTTWQKGTATSTADPSSCSFVAGDSIVFKIDLTADNDANAYASTLSFAFSNN